MGATVRCVIDDGSAQAELFMENGVAWELLTCTDGQRRRFEDILSNYVEELSYFSGRSANGNFATSMVEREQEYYQNELRAFVLDAIPSLRSVVVFAQRFYKTKQEQDRTSVLTFGKDIHLTTKTVPQPKLEAKRVDRLHVRSELQRRLAQLRLRSEPTSERPGQEATLPPTYAAPMQDPPADTEPQSQKKPGSTRARKTTPRTRAKKNAMESKKVATPRRRASPRNARKAQEAEKKEEKQADALEAAAAAVKEEQREEQRDATQGLEAVGKAENQQEMEELPPAKDTQLRRNYLQRIYRQLQSTHPHQDDSMIRQIATNVEMEACQASATRSQYVEAMDHEIHKLMQFEIQQANTPPVYASDTQSFDSNPQAQPVVSSEMQSGYSQQQMTQSRTFEYAQALAKAQSQEQASNGSRSSSFSTPRQSMSGDTSFQNLMNNPNPGYGRSSMQQQHQNTPTRVMNMQNLQQAGSPFSMATPLGQTLSQMEAQQQLGNFTMQQQMQQPGPMRTHSRPSTLQEFSAQIQHLDKSVLIELLWNQRTALAQWQRQAKHLELQLSAQKNAGNNMGSPGFQSSPYRYNSPMVGDGTFVNQNTNVEAEMQRARERSNSRVAQHQQHQMPQHPFAQQSNESSAGYSQAGGNTADWGENPQLYWEKIRLMKASYAEQLRTAQRALAQSTAPPNSLYSVKAQSMMQNIAMVLNILSERPTNVQPRKFDVLTSIDRFMQMSVTPIVQKVLSSGAMPHMNTSSQTVVASVPSPAVTASVATYSTVRTENDDAVVNQTENSTYQYDAPTITPKEPHTPALPASESRPSSVTDTQLSPGASLSPGENARDSSSKMQSSSLDDSLHDFSYFPEMDFEDPVPESSNFVKENNPSNIPRKRGIEDV
uniref:Uncharacterized protein n=1 Tax=Phytophthora ramorum TaxID=164328 RepID=H3GWB7_PHYRM